MTDRRVPVQKRALRTWNRILDASVSILSEEGHEAFNTNRIAEVAGISVGTLYGYFSDKEEIAAAVVARQAEREAAQLLARFETLGKAPLDQLTSSLVKFVFDLYQHHAALYRSLLALQALDREAVGQRKHEIQIIDTIVHQLISRGWHCDKARRTGKMAFLVVETLAFQSISSPTIPPRELREETVDLVNRYLGL